MRHWKGVGCLVVLLLAGCSDGGPDSASGDVAPMRTGEAVYHRYCFSCHAAGTAGAPKTGDAQAWAERVAKGKPQLLLSTVEGMPPAMPQRGLCFDCTDDELIAAIDYMLENSR